MQYNLGQSYDALIESQSDNIAFIYEDTTYLFSDLDGYVGKYVQVLLSNDFQKGDVICVANTKSIDSYAMMLASLKLGIAYTNLDVDNPLERISKMIQRCQPKAIFEDKGTENFKKLADDAGLLHLNTSSEYDEIATNEDLFSSIDGNTIAYIMFTSGSTGEPKGVAISHQNILHFINWVKMRYDVSSKDNFANISPMYFDNSVFDFYGGLFNGASLTPIKKQLLNSPIELVNYIDNKECTIWFSVPSMLVYLLNMKVLRQGVLQSIRVFTFGGEGFPKPNLKKLYDLYSSQAQIINVYGPTEGTCICSSHDITINDFDDMNELASLGKINPNFSYHIEEPNDEGVGELVIIGPCVGLGYYQLPDKSNRFFGVFNSGKHYLNRYYKTGDLVEERSGLLYFKGRKDNQIKHMGYRIELEEIENALISFPNIKECAVIYSRVNVSYGKIIAFIASDIELSIQDIKNHLKLKIPIYMIPNKFELRTELLKNANGKIDRKTLKLSI